MIVLLTGASGFVGTGLRRELAAAGHRLRLFVRKPLAELGTNEEQALGDIADAAAVLRATEGVGAVIHLAGCTTDAGIEDQIDGNIRGAFNVFEAARLCGVERVIFASSNHVVGYYPRSRRIDNQVLVRPDSRYGLTKAFGEQAGAMYADKYGLRVLCIRIGNVNDKPIDRRRLALWLSWRDLTQLVTIGLTHPALRYEVVYGVSGNDRTFYDNEAAFRLGYQPMDNAEDHAAAVLASTPPEDKTLPGTVAMGGDFANNEFVGSAARLHEW
jgi:uronate dehydrogenase